MAETESTALLGMSVQELESWLRDRFGEPRYRAQQIFQWMHQKNVFQFEDMKNLPGTLRQKLQENADIYVPPVLKEQSAPDGTRKLLLEMKDGKRVETVLIPQKSEGNRKYSICISTQVGCPVHCAFCATGNSGFYRNLKTEEIVGQVISSRQELHRCLHRPDTEKMITNVVYMGMGEPFLNYDATLASLRLLNAHEGLDIGQRRITVSTSGEVKGIQKLTRENLQVTLAVSLHACNDALRNVLVPMNRKYPLAELMKALALYDRETGRRITFEYILLEGKNMSRKDADDLIRYVKPLGANVNLIPYNEVKGLPFQRPSRKKVMEFVQYLREHDINVILRGEHGPNIQAACGQLAVQK